MNQNTMRKTRTTNHKSRRLKALAAIFFSLALLMSLFPMASVAADSVESAPSETAEKPAEGGDASEAEAPAAEAGKPDASDESGKAPEVITLAPLTMGDGTVITVEGALPEGTTVQAAPVQEKDTEQLEAALDEMAAENGKAVAEYAAYDITLWNGNEEIQPAEGQRVRVTIQRPAITPEGGETGIAHVDDAITEAKVVAEGTDTVEVEHFSIYVVYTLEGQEITVTFDVDGFEGTPLPSETVAPGETITPPTLPNELIPPGKALAGWTLNPASPVAFAFANTPITLELAAIDGLDDNNVTLYAWFTPKTDVSAEQELREAIAAAEEPTIITLTDNITLTNDAITIETGKKIVLTSGDGGPFTVTQSADARHFSVMNDASLTLENVTVKGLGRTADTEENGGIQEENGGINVESGGTLFLNNGSKITQCYNTYGGGVYAVDESTVTINGGEISNNVAQQYGGGVYMDGGSLNFNTGLVKDNTAVIGGGGVYVGSGAAFIMIGGEVSGNTATRHSTVTGDPGAFGGGVYVDLNAKFELSGTAKISGNFTPSSFTVTSQGSGVYNKGFLAMTGGEISNNHINGGTDGLGIGVYNAGSFLMSAGTITANIGSGGKGGGVYSAGSFAMSDGAKISGNQLPGSTGKTSGIGGGVYAFDGTFILSPGASITGNLVSGVDGRGGGVAVGHDVEFTMSGGSISGNEGNGVYVLGGGGATFNMTGGIISANTVSGVSTAGTFGGDASGTVFTMSDEAKIMDNFGNGVSVAEYTTFNMNGGTISGNRPKSGAVNGAGVYSTGTFNMKNGTISNNNGMSEGFTGSSLGNGGGVYVTNANDATAKFTMSGGVITDNTARLGGGIYGEYSTITIEKDALITKNTATATTTYGGGGGGVYLYNSKLGPGYDFNMLGGSITDNDALEGNGGGVFIGMGWRFNMQGGTINDNYTTQSGGGVYWRDMGRGATSYLTEFNFTGGIIDNNTADLNGGGVYAEYAESGFTIPAGAKITNNTAMQNGGGVYIQNMRDDNFAMTGGEISGNGATGGGGIYFNILDYVATISGAAEITNNTASGSAGGGGIYVKESDRDNLIVEDTVTFNQNEAIPIADYGLEKGQADYPNIQWKGDNSSPETHLLNNYDINNNYVYTVTFDANGGFILVGGNTRTVTNPATTVESLPTPMRSGYTFDSWNTSADGKGTAFTATTKVTGDITVYAKWTPITYTVTFDKNGGDTEANPGAMTVTSPDTTVGSLPSNPTKAGHTFGGWNTKADGKGSAFTATTPVYGNITVYAQWTAEAATSYTVTFDKNGGDTEANPGAMTVTSPDTTVGSLPTNPTKTGYTFDGWNTNANGEGTAFTATTPVTGSITVYAQWKAHTHTVIFDGEGNDDTTVTVTYPDTSVGSENWPDDPLKPGYNFDSWRTADDDAFTQTTDVPIATTDGGTTTVHPKWTPVNYNITYHYGGGTGTNLDTYNITTPSFSLNTPTREGFTFAGWTGTGVTGQPMNVTVANGTTGNLEFTAHWTAIPESVYAISYIYNGGVAPAVANPTSYTAAALPLTIENQPTRTGYTFAGWTGSNGSAPETSVTIATGATGNLAYTANWTPNTYAVTYNANGGAGSMAGQTATYGQNLTLRANAFTRTGYTFAGWNTQPNGTGTAHANGAAFEPWRLTGGLNLYAQWTRNVYTVRFLNWNGNEISAQRVAHGDTLTLPANPTRAGFTFTGWTPAVVTTVTANADYTAQYTAIYYTVTFAPGLHGAFAAQTTADLTFGAATPAAPGITGEDGWIFTGWAPVPAATVTRSATYTAQWAEDTTDDALFTVTFVDWDETVLKTEQVAPGGSATAPATPAREGYTFDGWDSAFTNVQANITVTAQYVLNPVSGTEEQPGATPDGGTATPPGDGGVTVPGATDPANPTPDEVLTALADEGIPSMMIGDQEVPLAAGPFTQFVWALLNLILALTGVALAVVSGIHALRRKQRERDGIEDEVYDYETENETKTRKQRRLVWLIVAIVMGVAGIVLFLLTEDMRHLMALVDSWTPVNAVILVAELIGIFFSFKTSRVEETEEEELV